MEDAKTTKKAALAIAGIAGAALIVGAGCAQDAGKPTADAGNAGPKESAVPTKTAAYKDGTYEAMGSYRSPAGPEQIDISLTIKDNVVTDGHAVAQATAPKSVHFQGLFVSGFHDAVVGKNVNDLALDNVSGSSLTPRGFNDALAKIKAQAAS
jgi:uncharacterized protein with FMN-binding domain